MWAVAEDRNVKPLNTLQTNSQRYLMAHVYVTLPLKVVSQKLIVAFLDYTNSRNLKMLLSWIFFDFFLAIY